jgi:hypothetical protein
VFLPPGFADEARLEAMKVRVEAALPNDTWFISIRLNQRIAPK